MALWQWILMAVVAGLMACVLAGVAWESLAERRDRRRFPAPGLTLDIGGRRLHGLILGNSPGARGPMVVIEQGLASPATTWRGIQEAVAGFAPVCAYDRGGYLWSDPIRGERSFEARAADLHAWLAGCGVPPPYVFVAHSFGGLVIQAFARAWPQAVAGLVLVDSIDAPLMFSEKGLSYLRQGLAIQHVIRALARVGLVRWLGRRAPVLLPQDPPGIALSLRPRHFGAILDDMRTVLRTPPASRAGLPAGCLGGRPLAVLTHGIPFPPMAAVLEEGWGEAQQRLAALSGNSELIVATKSNHLIHLDEPGVVIEAVRRVHAAARDGGRLGAQGHRPQDAA